MAAHLRAALGATTSIPSSRCARTDNAGLGKAGTKLVWVVDPEREEVRVYRPDGSLTIVPLDGSIDGEDVLPGFACSVRDVLR